MKLLRLLPFFAAIALCCSCATTSRRGALERANESYNAGAFREALNHATRAANYNDGNALAKAEAIFLQARCHDALNEPAAAIPLYRILAQDFGSTNFGSFAKKRLAELQR